MLKQPTLPKVSHPLDRIAFAGPMCSGKTTLANTLVADFGYTKLNFARILKDTARNLYGVISKDDKGRQILQELADDLKKWDPYLFTTHLLLDIERSISESEALITVDDLRFKHEYDALKANGFTVIGVACREDIRMSRVYNLYPDTDPIRFSHSSEMGWKDMKMDYWVDNTGPSGEIELHDIILGSVGSAR